MANTARRKRLVPRPGAARSTTFRMPTDLYHLFRTAAELFHNSDLTAVINEALAREAPKLADRVAQRRAILNRPAREMLEHFLRLRFGADNLRAVMNLVAYGGGLADKEKLRRNARSLVVQYNSLAKKKGAREWLNFTFTADELYEWAVAMLETPIDLVEGAEDGREV